MELLSIETLGLLFLAALTASTIDAMAGGGGLITLPAMLLAGLPPTVALATNKAQSVFGSGSATFKFHQKRLINWKTARLAFTLSLLGAALGAYLVQMIDTRVLEKIIPFCLIVIAGYFALGPKADDIDKHAITSERTHAMTAGAGIGFYDGFFGPGTGSFFALSYVGLLGYGLTKATAHTKALNFASNAGALIVFMFSGHINYTVAAVMAVGALAGGRLGATLVHKVGARLIRPVLITMCIVMALKLLVF